MKKVFFVISFLLIIQNLYAQRIGSDSVTVEPEVPILKEEKSGWLPKPSKATIMSAILPGLGQAYNRSYWKIPIIYAAEGTLLYLIFYNQNNFKDFGEAYNNRSDTSFIQTEDERFANFTTDQLRLARDDYRRNRDLSIIIAVAVYGIQILDANVDAHLKAFKLNEELSMEIKPFFYTHNTPNLASGLTLSLKFH